MVTYSDYQDVLFSTNFIGGGGQSVLPNPDDDDRAEVAKDANNVYQFYYYALTSLSDLNDLGYYDTPTTDTDSDPLTNDREYNQLPTGNDPSLSTSQQTILSSVLGQSTYGASFADVANINFSIGTTGNADIVIGQTTNGEGVISDDGGYEHDYSNGADELRHGDIWLNQDFDLGFGNLWNDTDKGDYGFFVVLHEVAHALGLAHPPAGELDSMQYTVMSTDFMAGMNPIDTSDDVLPSSLQLLDIAALQEIYGANYNTRADDTTYSKATALASSRPNDAFVYTIWDGGGNDTIDVSGFTSPDGATIDLREGSFSSVGLNAEGNAAANNLAIAYNAVIENATGTDHDDFLYGNQHDNVLNGGAGNDTFEGHGGSDSLNGGAGNDSFLVDVSNAETFTIVDGGADTDTFEYTGGTNVEITAAAIKTQSSIATNVENVTLATGLSHSTYIDDLGRDYDFSDSFSGSNAGWIDYSSYGAAATDALTIDISNATWQVSANGSTDEFDSNDNDVIASIIGSNWGDTVTLSNNQVSQIWLGTGDDDITAVGSHVPTIIYSGGDDTIASGSHTIRFDSTIQYASDSDIQFEELNKTNIVTVGNVQTYDFDLKIAIAGKGTITIDDVSAQIDAGADSTFGTSDDNYSTLGGPSVIELWNSTRITFGSSITDEALSGSGTFDQLDTTPFDELTITGTSGNDTMNGYGQDDTLNGGAGHDILNGNGGEDTLNGGAGDDTILGGLGDDTLNGEAGLDIISGGAGVDVIHGNDGDDTLLGQAHGDFLYGDDGDDTLDGGHGDDTLYGGDGIDLLLGGSGDDDLFGEADNDTLRGGYGADDLEGGVGNDTLQGEMGDDTLNGGFGDDTLEGGVDDDTYIYIEGDGYDTITETSGDDTIQLGSTIDLSNFGSYRSGDDLILETFSGGATSGRITVTNYFLNTNNVVETIQFAAGGLNITGTDDDDSLTGTTYFDYIRGRDGDDTLNGGNGDDRLRGDDGDDLLFGDVGDDLLQGRNDDDTLNGGAGDDELEGGAGNDTFVYSAGLDQAEESSGTDTILFDDGIDLYDLSFQDSGTTDTKIVLNTNTDEILLVNQRSANINEHFESVAFDNGLSLNLADYNNWQWGTSAFEAITGGSGNDTILGGAGNDNLKGKAGNDQIDGGDGNDKIWGGAGDDYIFGGLGLDTLRGEDGNDTLVGASDNDTLYGGNGDDILNGGIDSGFDNLYGEAGDDTLYATAGNDFLRGGTGSDTFVLTDINHFTGTAAVTIKSGFDSNPSGDNDALDIKDVIDFDSGTGDILSNFVALSENASNTTVSVDVDGIGTAHSWTTVAIIQNVTGEWTDATDMLAQNNLIVE